MGFRWQGPLSLAVYAPGTDFETALETIFFYRFSKIKIFLSHHETKSSKDK